MATRYDFEQDKEGRAVFDVFTGQPVVIGGVLQVGLDMQDASALAELLE